MKKPRTAQQLPSDNFEFALLCSRDPNCRSSAIMVTGVVVRQDKGCPSHQSTAYSYRVVMFVCHALPGHRLAALASDDI